jgi:adenylate cyclase
LRAVPHMAPLAPADARIAAGFLEDALKMDPGYAVAHALLAWCHQICFLQGGFDRAEKISGLQHARMAIANDVDDTTSLAIGGMVIAHLGKDHETALSAIERALSLNASCAMAHYFAGHIYAFAGNSGAATAHAERALRLSPFDLLAWIAPYALGMVAVHESRFDDAASWFAKVAQGNSAAAALLYLKACSLALAGRIDDAETTARQALELSPGLRIRIFSEMGMLPSIAEKFTEGARLLGLPE